MFERKDALTAEHTTLVEKLKRFASAFALEEAAGTGIGSALGGSKAADQNFSALRRAFCGWHPDTIRCCTAGY